MLHSTPMRRDAVETELVVRCLRCLSRLEGLCFLGGGTGAFGRCSFLVLFGMHSIGTLCQFF